MIKLFLLSVSLTSFWIEPSANKGDSDLARWAFAAWETASKGRLHFVETKDREAAQIQVVWATYSSGLYGEVVGKVVNVSVPPEEIKDSLLRDTIVYLTCLHESGHALGLAHTANFDDIMYNFQYGGDIPEYFARYRRKLSTREDIEKNPGLSASDRARIAARPPAP
jgi:hypothetical protein